MLRLHSCKQFLDLGFRPYLGSIMKVLRCAQDIQWWHGSSALLSYVSGYVSKFEKAFDPAWLEDSTTPWQTAAAVARNWRPAVPEMAMVLSRCPLASTNVTTVRYKPPALHDEEDAPLFCYRRRQQENQTFMEWLRCHVWHGSVVDGSAPKKLLPKGVLAKKQSSEASRPETTSCRQLVASD